MKCNHNSNKKVIIIVLITQLKCNSKRFFENNVSEMVCMKKKLIWKNVCQIINNFKLKKNYSTRLTLETHTPQSTVNCKHNKLPAKLTIFYKAWKLTKTKAKQMLNLSKERKY